MNMLQTTRQRSTLDADKIENFMHICAASKAFQGGAKQIYTIKSGETAPKLLYFYRQDAESIHAAAEKLYFSGKLPYYVTKNTFFGDQRRNSALFSIDNIVIDLDDHTGKLHGAQLDYAIDKLCFTLDEDYSGRMPRFNLTRSGRGAHLWIPLESFSAKMQLYHNIYAHSICDTVGKAVQAINSPLQLDRAATMNAAGLIRLPFTINQHTRQLATFEQRTEYRHTIDDVQEYCAINLDSSGREYERQHGRRCKANDDSAFIPLQKKRLRFLDAVIDRADDLTGRRDLICFLYCNAAYMLTGDGETARQKAHAANSRLSAPLKPAEIDRIAKYVTEKGGLCFKNETFFDFMSATLYERQLYIYNLPNQRETDRAAARERKAERNAEIMRLHAAGCTVTEIVTRCNCTRPTVNKVLKG